MKKSYVFLIMLIFLIFFVSANAEEITIVTTSDFPPYNFVENGNPTGYSTEIAEAVVIEAEFVKKVQVSTWARAYKTAQDEKNIMIPINRNSDREALFKWVGSIAQIKMYFYKRKDNIDIKIQSLNDAKKYLIGIVRNDFTSQLLKKHGFEEGINLVAVNETQQNYKKLLNSRIDLIAASNEILFSQFNKLNLDFSKVEKVFMLDNSTHLFLACSLDTPDEIIHRLTKALNRIKKNGTLDKIKNKYKLE